MNRFINILKTVLLVLVLLDIIWTAFLAIGLGLDIKYGVLIHNMDVLVEVERYLQCQMVLLLVILVYMALTMFGKKRHIEKSHKGTHAN